MEREFLTDYASAVSQLDMVLCNNIAEVDPSIFDNMEYGELEENEDGDYNYPEIYQYYLLGCSQSEIEYRQSTYPDLIFSYSELLDLYVLCVDHWGTSWKGVATRTRNQYDKPYRD